MAKQLVNIGVSPNTGGDPARIAFEKVNSNNSELYTALGADAVTGLLPLALPIGCGGTGATTKEDAITNLGLGTAALLNVEDLPSGGGSGGNEYVLPKASTTTLGGVKVGNGLAIDTDGVLTTEAQGVSVTSVNGEVGEVVVKAENLSTLNGNTQQELNDRGGATWYAKSGGYSLNYRVILGSGDIVRSTAPNNTVDPNVDMTGWVETENKAYIGLSNVDNTSDIDKPVSTATNLAIISATQDKVSNQDLNSAVSPKADTTYVDTAIGAISTDGSKQYATLALANADIASINLNQNVFVSEAVNGGYWYKATVGATSLTKSPYDPLTQAKTYADANGLFKPIWLTSGQDVHVLNDGLYRFTTTVGATLLNLPPGMGTYKAGVIRVDRDSDVSKDRGIAKISLTLYYDVNEIKTWEKTGNGGSTGFTWLPWQKQVSRYEYELNKTAVSNSIATMSASKAEINLFPNFALTSESSSTYQATLSKKNGYPTLTLDKTGVKFVAYDMAVVSSVLDVGCLVSFSTEGFCTTTSFNSGDLSIQALNSAGTVLQSSPSAYITTANAWQKITATLTLPAGTTKIRLRMINRNGAGNTLCEFRNASLVSDYVFLKFFNPAAAVNIPSSIFHVSKTGNDNNNGLSSASAFLTLQKAINSLPSYGGVIEVGGGFYRETATVSSKGNVWIRSKRNERVVIFGSDQLVVTKTSGFTQVYQSPLTAKPVGMGSGRGKPVIFEFGTLSKPILDADRQHLHKSRTHRLPYTEMFEAATKAELDTIGGNGKWFWESGIIYFAATDGSDATLKQYEARVRPTIIQMDGVLHLTRIDTFFSTAEGGLFGGIMVDREDCRTFGNYFNGWSDNCNITKSLNDEAGGNGNDGINGTVTSYNVADVNTRLIAHYVEPHVHDNGDDGLSYHYRGNVRITGGVGEYNTKADFVHVTGATCVCDGTVAQGTLNGFYAATTATGDTERTKTYFKCINTKSRNNTYSYRAADDAVMECENTKAINPTGYGYYQTGSGAINALDCKYSGAPSKMKFGTVNVTNTESLT